MQSRTVSRELALLMLGQLSDRGGSPPESETSLETLLLQAITSLGEHVREALDRSAEDLQSAQQDLLDSELQQEGADRLPRVRQHLRDGLAAAELALNRLSAGLELPRMLLLAGQDEVRRGAIDRARAVLHNREQIDRGIDAVMEGWRLHRLPRIDRDILRLAAVELSQFRTPPAVVCSEAVELANRYSDDQGRRMINGVLRRYTTMGAKG